MATRGSSSRYCQSGPRLRPKQLPRESPGAPSRVCPRLVRPLLLSSRATGSLRITIHSTRTYFAPPNNAADKACHVVGSATQVGLIQVLGHMRSVCRSQCKSKLQLSGYSYRLVGMRLAVLCNWRHRLSIRCCNLRRSLHEFLRDLVSSVAFWLREVHWLLVLRSGCACVPYQLALAVGYADLGCGLTMRSSRNRFVPPNTWQVKLAMCLAPLRGSA